MQIEKLDKSHFLIKELIDSYREDWQRKQGQRDKEKRQRFYMSDVSKCDREIYYLFHNPEKKRTIADRTLILFRNGDMQHEEAQFRLKKQKVVDNSRDLEFGLEDWEVQATGRLDFFAQDNGNLTITEVKAKNPYGFQNEEPEQWEIDQLLWYIFAAKKSKNLKQRKINNYGYILYIEGWPVSDFPFISWKIQYDEKRIAEIRKRFKKLWKVIQEEKLPNRQFERNSIKCQYCRLKEFCWQGVPEEPKKPEIKSDETIEKPEQELIDSAVNRYLKLKEELKEKKEEFEQVYEILLKYFKATGNTEIPIGDKILEYSLTKRMVLNNQYLLNKLKDKWHLFSKPQIKLLQQAIKDGNVDPEIFERAKIFEFIDTIRIKKGGKNANQKS